MNSPRNRVGPWVAPRRAGPPLVEELNGIEVAIERQKKLAKEFRDTARVLFAVLVGVALAVCTLVTVLALVAFTMVCIVDGIFGNSAKVTALMWCIPPLAFCALCVEWMLWRRFVPWFEAA